MKTQFRFGIFFISIILVGLSCSQKTNYKNLEKPFRPNILFIMVDDLGKEWISCYGAEDIQTPHIDQLATNGIRFTNAYSMPQCTPTRITLMTGQYPFRHGWVNHWDVPRWGGGCHFDWNRNPSVARLMKQAGYATAAAGKWQVNDFRVQPEAMVHHGFDDYCMWTGYEGGNPPSGERFWDPYIHTKAGSKTYEGQYGEDVFADFLIDFMQKHKEEPMFLYFPMCLTHPPLVTTPLEPELPDEPLVKHKAMVRYTDLLVGKLVEALEELGIRENTLIFFTTDNGTSKGITGTLNGRQVKGKKGETLEAGTCEPFIVNGPGVPEGVVSDALIDFTDLLPTFVELAGGEIPAGQVVDGRSFSEVVRGNSPDSPRSWMMSMGGKNNARLTAEGVENQYYFRDRVIRNKRYKLYIGPNRQAVKLVDVIEDPEEKTNLMDVPQESVQQALEQLENVVRQFPERDNDPIYDPLPAQDWDVSITAKSEVWKRGHPQYDSTAILTPAPR